MSETDGPVSPAMLSEESTIVYKGGKAAIHKDKDCRGLTNSCRLTVHCASAFPDWYRRCGICWPGDDE